MVSRQGVANLQDIQRQQDIRDIDRVTGLGAFCPFQDYIKIE
jgi:hypothetical protein